MLVGWEKGFELSQSPSFCSLVLRICVGQPQPNHAVWSTFSIVQGCTVYSPKPRTYWTFIPCKFVVTLTYRIPLSLSLCYTVPFPKCLSDLCVYSGNSPGEGFTITILLTDDQICQKEIILIGWWDVLVCRRMSRFEVMPLAVITDLWKKNMSWFSSKIQKWPSFRECLTC